jgi:hypothetical protein
MQTHGVCFDAAPRMNRDRIVECTVILTVRSDGMRVATSRRVTRIDPVLATRSEIVRGFSSRGSSSPMCGYGRLAAIPSTRPASAH